MTDLAENCTVCHKPPSHAHNSANAHSLKPRLCSNKGHIYMFNTPQSWAQGAKLSGRTWASNMTVMYCPVAPLCTPPLFPFGLLLVGVHVRMCTGVFDVCEGRGKVGRLCVLFLYLDGGKVLSRWRDAPASAPCWKQPMRLRHAHTLKRILHTSGSYPPLSATLCSGHATGQPVRFANFGVSRWPVAGCDLDDSGAMQLIYI